MVPPTSIDGTNITGVTIDGTVVNEITVDGDIVFKGPRIYHFGGQSVPSGVQESNGPDIDEIYEYDPATDSIAAMTATLPQATSWASAAAVDDKIYHLGGFATQPEGFSSVTDAIYEYDPSKDSIATMSATLPETNAEATAEAVDGKIYNLGGSTGAEIIEYDPATDSIATMSATLPERKSYTSSAVVDGKIYVLGGEADGFNITDDIYEYDPTTDSIATVSATLPRNISMATAAAVDGKIYHLGGQDGNFELVDDIYEYDPATDSIATMSATIFGVPPNFPSFFDPDDFEFGVYQATAAAFGGKIYHLGGDSSVGGFGVNNKIFEFDPASDTVTQMFARLPKNIRRATAVST